MRASEFFAVRPHLERAVVDVRYFLNGEKENEKTREESSELYDLMEANETPPDVKGQGRPELTPEHYAALEWRTADGDPVTDAQREAILDEVLPGQPMSDAGLAALERAWRGGWRESSRQAAVWLRNAGETVAADGIDWALSRLRGEPKDAAERSQHRDAMRTAAEYVLTILTTCLASGGAVADVAPTDARGVAERKRRGRKKADYETVQKEAALAAEWERARDAGIYKPDFAKDKNMTARQLDALLDRVAKRKRASE